MFFWCMFLELDLTKYHLNIVDPLRQVIELGMSMYPLEWVYIGVWVQKTKEGREGGGSQNTS